MDFDLPCTYPFYYYRLWHAVRAQFGSLDNPIQVPPLEKLLRCPDPAKLISTYYAALITDSNPRFQAAQTRWASLVVPFTEGDWSEFSGTYKTSVISSRDCVIQLKIFHHSHLTPARLNKMGWSLRMSSSVFTLPTFIGLWTPFIGLCGRILL